MKLSYCAVKYIEHSLTDMETSTYVSFMEEVGDVPMPFMEVQRHLIFLLDKKKAGEDATIGTIRWTDLPS